MANGCVYVFTLLLHLLLISYSTFSISILFIYPCIYLCPYFSILPTLFLLCFSLSILLSMSQKVSNLSIYPQRFFQFTCFINFCSFSPLLYCISISIYQIFYGPVQSVCLYLSLLHYFLLFIYTLFFSPLFSTNPHPLPLIIILFLSHQTPPFCLSSFD